MASDPDGAASRPPSAGAPGPASREISRLVLLNDVDAAGVVFYARIMAMAHEAYEVVMAGAGMALDGLMRERIGLPLVHAHADFSHPLRHGDLALLRVRCARIGESSVTFEIGVGVGQRAAAVVTHVHACVDMDALSSRPLPPALRAKLGTLTG